MAEYSKTINQLVDLLLSRVRSETGTTAPLYAQALNDLNLALQELAISHTWKWMRKEVSLTIPATTRLLNSATIASYPTDVVGFKQLISVVDGIETPLTLITESEAAELYPDLTATGAPVHYIIGPAYIASVTSAPVRVIELRPAPISQVTLKVSYEYNFKLYTSAEGTEVPPIPPYYYECLLELAATKLLRFTKNNKNEIDDAKVTSALLLLQLAKKDADMNKKESSIRLRSAVRSYRASRYD